jgi:hypothetical protein
MSELQDANYDKWQVGQLLIWTYINQTTSWLMHSWNTFDAWTTISMHRFTRFTTT